MADSLILCSGAAVCAGRQSADFFLDCICTALRPRINSQRRRWSRDLLRKISRLARCPVALRLHLEPHDTLGVEDGPGVDLPAMRVRSGESARSAPATAGALRQGN